MEDQLKLRFMAEEDLEEIFEAERLAGHPHPLGAKGMLGIAKQRKDEASGMYDSRVMCVDMAVPHGQWTCAAFGYELQPAGYELVFTILHPEAQADKILQMISFYLCGKADRSPTRRRVTVYLRDQDESGLRTLLPFWRSHGFDVQLVPDHFDDCDGWRCVYESAIPSAERGQKDDDK